MTTPEPLHLGSDFTAQPPSNDERRNYDAAVVITVVPRVAYLNALQVRALIRWLGEHAVADLPDHLGYVRCARCTVLFDPVTGHHCAATDDEQVRGWLAGEATVTHVEGQPQP
jgi:hypothetical protein